MESFQCHQPLIPKVVCMHFMLISLAIGRLNLKASKVYCVSLWDRNIVCPSVSNFLDGRGIHRRGGHGQIAVFWRQLDPLLSFSIWRRRRVRVVRLHLNHSHRVALTFSEDMYYKCF